MTPQVAVAAVILDADGRVLLIRRGRPPGEGLWTFPGGRVEAGERLAAAVAREVAEETGLEVACGPLVEVVERLGDGWHYVILDFLASPRGGALRAGSDAADARFVAPDELAALPVTDGLRPVLDRARALAATLAPPPAER